MIAALGAGLVAGYGVALPVGAVAIYLVTLTARTSARVGISAAFGVATADAVYAVLAVVGGSALADRAESISGALRVLSCVVLVGLAARLSIGALRSWGSGAEPHLGRSVTLSPARAYVGLLGVTLVNPTTVVYFVALIVGRGGASLSGSDRAGFVVGVLVASASCQLAFASSGALLGRAVIGRRSQLITALVSSAVIVALAVRIALR